jgi:hypothetical protein
VVRFLIGGLVVSAFAIIGGLFKPTSFAGLFGAAPSVALATLSLAIATDGKQYASTECLSMIAGALAMGVYCLVVSRLLMRRRMSALRATLTASPVWFAVAFGLWKVIAR